MNNRHWHNSVDVPEGTKFDHALLTYGDLQIGFQAVATDDYGNRHFINTKVMLPIEAFRLIAKLADRLEEIEATLEDENEHAYLSDREIEEIRQGA